MITEGLALYVLWVMLVYGIGQTVLVHANLYTHLIFHMI